MLERMKMRKILCTVLLCICLATPMQASLATSAETAVHLAGDKYVRTELYFGMSRKSGPDVTEEEFEKFVDEFVTPRFPDGLTVIDAHGQWREADATVIKERSKLLVFIYPRKERRAAGSKIEEIRTEYKRRFSQESVLRLDLGKAITVSF